MTNARTDSVTELGRLAGEDSSSELAELAVQSLNFGAGELVHVRPVDVLLVARNRIMCNGY